MIELLARIDSRLWFFGGKKSNEPTVLIEKCIDTSFSASFSLPFVNECHKDCHNVERIIELDGILQAYLSNHVANRASFRQVRLEIILIVSHTVCVNLLGRTWFSIKTSFLR